MLLRSDNLLFRLFCKWKFRLEFRFPLPSLPTGSVPFQLPCLVSLPSLLPTANKSHLGPGPLSIAPDLVSPLGSGIIGNSDQEVTYNALSGAGEHGSVSSNSGATDEPSVSIWTRPQPHHSIGTGPVQLRVFCHPILLEVELINLSEVAFL